MRVCQVLLLVSLLWAFAKTCQGQAVSTAEFDAWAARNSYQLGRDWRSYLLIAPGNMGPNALPVSRSNFGYVDSVSSLGASAAVHFNRQDPTQDVALHGVYRLGKRASLQVHYLLREWYDTSPELATARNSLQRPARGSIDGDVQVNVLLDVLGRRADQLNAVVAVRVKTASGSGLEALRFTDSPGYQFDASLGKSYRLDAKTRLRPYGSGGFFVWQRFGAGSPQNDAYTYSAGLRFERPRLQCAVELAGYSGWTEQQDRPVQLRSVISFQQPGARFRGQLHLTHGLRDYGYTSLRTSLIYSFLAQRRTSG